MQLNLVRNGYNLQRRKLYPLNPRNNMVSSIDMSWNKSLQDQNNFSNTKLKNKISQEKQTIKHHYIELLDRQIQQQKSLDKSTFRVLPLQKNPRNNYDSLGKSELIDTTLASRRNSIQFNNNFRTINNNSSLERAHLTSKQILQPVTVRPQLKKSENLSRTVFGYEINPENFKRQSYLTKMLSSRLDPYLQQTTHRRHNSIMANQVIGLNY